MSAPQKGVRTEVYRFGDGAAFPVSWPYEGAREHTWSWDQVKNPLPLTPIAREFLETKREGMARAGGMMGRPAPSERIYVNGFAYSRNLPVEPVEAASCVAVRDRDTANRLPRLMELWRCDYLPETERIVADLQSWRLATASLATLVTRFDEVLNASRRLGVLHNLTMTLSGLAMDEYLSFCRDQFGDEGDEIAQTTVAGMPNKSVESAVSLWELSRGGGRDIDSFLAEWGQRNESFFEVAEPTWLEDRSFVRSAIAAYAGLPGDRSPAAMHSAIAERRMAVVRQARGRVRGRGAAAHFDTLLKRAQAHTTLMEDHNFHIDQRGHTSLRYPCLAIGGALVSSGSIDQPPDVFYLQSWEFEEAVVDRGVRFHDRVWERRAERERWLGVIPPTRIGGASPTSAPAPADVAVIRGLPASGGVATSTARVILSLEDASRLSPSEILITYATAPSWTPLFAIAGGVVTDAGGALSHCAIVAREYGIPAVVGATGATGRIADGSRITINGSNGTIRLEPD